MTVEQVRPKGLRVIAGGDRRSRTTPAEPKVLDLMRKVLRSGLYSRSSERSYCNWVKRFILFHVRTTVVYIHVLNLGGQGVRSPVDCLWRS